MKKILAAGGKFLFWLTMMVVVAAVTAGSLFPAVRGWVPLTVLTGSMNGTQAGSFAPGDLVVVKPLFDAERETPQIGDVVSFHPRPNDATGLTTHRVVDRIEASDGSISFVTQGDANGAPDAPIMAKQVAGAVQYSVPKLGFAANALPGEVKPVIVYTVAATLIGAGVVMGIRAALPARGKRKEEEDQSQDQVPDQDQNKEGDATEQVAS